MCRQQVWTMPAAVGGMERLKVHRRPGLICGLLMGVVMGVGLPQEAFAQQASIRALVVDEQEEPLPNVNVEVHFKGAPGIPARTIKTRTNRRGYVVRVGLTPGPYELTFSKDGYQTQVVELHLSAGDLSEIPDVVMKASPAAVATPSADRAGGVDFAGLEADLKGAEVKKVIDAFGKAVEAARAGDLDAAERLDWDVVARAPGFAAAHYNLGQVHRRKQNWPEAEQAFEKAITLEPDVSDAYIALAAVHEQRGDEKKALDILEKGGTRFEQDAGFQFNLGIMYLNAGRVQEAEAAFRRAQAIDPGNPELHYYLGTLAIGRNELDQAVEHLERYLSDSGQNPQNLATARVLLDTLKSKP
jgi:lipopolysaccharide biosynthesis regulator YciM